MDDTIRIFIGRILKAGNADVRQYAWHEAGHRLMWRAMFPDVPTHYGIQGGLPCVMRDDGAHSLKISEMTIEDASRYTYIKLGGIAAEMVLFGIGAHAVEIAEWTASDYLARDKAQIDWEDDAEHGGDIPEAARIIIAKTGERSFQYNFRRTLVSCVENILNNRDEFDRECAEAESYFTATAAAGLWSLE